MEHLLATSIFIFFFLLVTVVGFWASKWRKADLSSLHEWGLAGRSLGTVISWFLIGGDLYTAYTFIAVPAAMYAAGANSFFAVPYTILIYPMGFFVLPKLWSVSHKHGFVTPADFVRARFGSRQLALFIALTGMIATMPYIALQLVGIQVVIAALGFPTTGLMGDLPLLLAFAVLAAYTYNSGLRAPALIAVVKDVLIYITVIAAVIVVPYKLGGFGNIFSHVPPAKLLLKAPDLHSLNQFSGYTTLALGSAMALFLYPHSTTAFLSSSGPQTLRRNMVLLPAYSMLLGLLALLGYMALALGLEKLPEYKDYFHNYGGQFAVPALFLSSFPEWFVGVAFAAIAIGALVPAAIMSIAAANLFTRNIYKEFIAPDCTSAQETKVAKMMSLIVKVGALAFVLLLDKKYAINLQLLGGVWIIQTLPAVFLGLFTRWFDFRGLICGWLAGVAWGTWVAYSLEFKPIYPLHIGDFTVPGYTALYALVLNVVVATIVTVIVRAMKMAPGADQTVATDYMG